MPDGFWAGALVAAGCILVADLRRLIGSLCDSQAAYRRAADARAAAELASEEAERARAENERAEAEYWRDSRDEDGDDDGDGWKRGRVTPLD